MLVEPLTPDDHEGLRLIARLGQQELDLEGELSRGWARIWVAREAQRAPIAAFLLAWFVADEVHVINVATNPTQRRKGAARALIDQVLAEARTHRVRLVLLEVRRSNLPAVSLYRSHGFSVIGVRRGYYADTGEDALEMLLALDPQTGLPLPGRDEVAEV